MADKELSKGFFRSVLAAVTAIFVFFIATQCYSFFRYKYKTAIAVTDTISDNFLCDGVMVFQYQTVPGDDQFGYLVADGEKVLEGSAVAEVYANAEQAACRDRLNVLDEQIAVLEKSQNVGSSEMSVYLEHRQDALYDLVEALDRGEYAQAAEHSSDYLLAANRVSMATGQVSSFEDTLQMLRSEREKVAEQLGSPKSVKAPAGGYFLSPASAATLVSCEQADDIKNALPDKLADILKDKVTTVNTDGLAGCVVTTYHWTYYALCNADEVKDVEAGDSLKISFPGKMETQIPVKVAAIQTDASAKNDSVVKLVLEGEYINRDVLTLGHSTAQIELATYTGIKFPAKALRSNDGVQGVYIKFGETAQFRPIEIIYKNEDYILVPRAIDQKKDSVNKLQLYDEVIVEGKALDDGKLL